MSVIPVLNPPRHVLAARENRPRAEHGYTIKELNKIAKRGPFSPQWLDDDHFVYYVGDYSELPFEGEVFYDQYAEDWAEESSGDAANGFRFVQVGDPQKRHGPWAVVRVLWRRDAEAAERELGYMNNPPRHALAARENRPSRKWSGQVRTRWSPPAGLFAHGSAHEIAEEVLHGHRGDRGASVRSIQFYLNRGGRNLSRSRRRTIEHAKRIVQGARNNPHDDGRVQIVYTARPNENAGVGGWLPVIYNNGRMIGSTWSSYGFDKDEALHHARNKAHEEAGRYAGDWHVTVEASESMRSNPYFAPPAMQYVAPPPAALANPYFAPPAMQYVAPPPAALANPVPPKTRLTRKRFENLASMFNEHGIVFIETSRGWIARHKRSGIQSTAGSKRDALFWAEGWIDCETESYLAELHP